MLKEKYIIQVVEEITRGIDNIQIESIEPRRAEEQE